MIEPLSFIPELWNLPMRAVDITIKKRDGGELSQEDIFFIQGKARDKIPEYQATALAVAVFFNGMTPLETTHLILAILASGESLDLCGVVS
jgi:pyrimidine-nucleoside phosphorylase